MASNLARGLVLAALVLAAASGVRAQTVVEYIHTDALGTPVAVTNSAGTVIERSVCEPYGQLINRPLTDGPGFAGHVQDAATGLIYMQKRYYDPQVGVFLSVDPVTANSDPVEMFHRYRYANNSPYKFTDPDGREGAAVVAKVTGQCDHCLGNGPPPKGTGQVLAAASVVVAGGACGARAGDGGVGEPGGSHFGRQRVRCSCWSNGCRGRSNFDRKASCELR